MCEFVTLEQRVSWEPSELVSTASSWYSIRMNTYLWAARSKSFVGTAEYVCPELLLEKQAGLAYVIVSFRAFWC